MAFWPYCGVFKVCSQWPLAMQNKHYTGIVKQL